MIQGVILCKFGAQSQQRHIWMRRLLDIVSNLRFGIGIDFASTCQVNELCC